jgi:hypothetical protein
MDGSVNPAIPFFGQNKAFVQGKVLSECKPAQAGKKIIAEFNPDAVLLIVGSITEIDRV